MNSKPVYNCVQVKIQNSVRSIFFDKGPLKLRPYSVESEGEGLWKVPE